VLGGPPSSFAKPLRKNTRYRPYVSNASAARFSSRRSDDVRARRRSIRTRGNVVGTRVKEANIHEENGSRFGQTFRDGISIIDARITVRVLSVQSQEGHQGGVNILRVMHEYKYVTG